jgi:hypothetical protein
MFRKLGVSLLFGWLSCLVTTADAQEGATPPATSSLQIAEHHFGLEVVDREIREEVDTFHLDDVVYLWLRVEGGPAEPITVTWSSDDVRYDVALRIGGSPWRTWARKTLFRAGEWTVQVKDSGGAMLLERTLQVLESPRAADQ